MEWDRLEAFVAVARSGGFTAAARSLGRTQSAISQSVAALERSLGQELFVREGRRVRLSEAGAILLTHAEQAFATLALAERRLQALSELESGRLLLGTSDTLAYYVLPEALRVFAERYPGIEVVLETRPSPRIAEAVAKHELDAGVVSLPLPAKLGGERAGDRLRTEALGEQRDVLIVAPDHELAGTEAIGFEALAGQKLLLLGRDSAGRAHVDEQLRRAGVEPTVAMEMSSVEVLKRLTELGFGAAIVPALSVRREVEAATLVARPLKVQGPGRQIGLLLPARLPPSRPAEAFAELLRTQLPAICG
ncbi:MAG: LysR family transcriptional regulator [Myxococcales bacterium]|nr:LysR family transcriptional regulator [Myxococcales bacterium]